MRLPQLPVCALGGADTPCCPERGPTSSEAAADWLARKAGVPALATLASAALKLHIWCPKRGVC